MAGALNPRLSHAPGASESRLKPRLKPRPVVDAAPAAVAAEPSLRERRGPMRPDRLISARERLSGEILSALIRGVDAAAAVALAWLVYDLQHPAGVWASPVGRAIPYFAGAVLLVCGLGMVEAYGFRARERLSAHLARTGAAFGVTGLVLAIALAAGRASASLFEGVGAWFALSFATVHMLHAWWWAGVRRMRRSGRLAPNVVVVGATQNAERLIARALEQRDVAVLGVFDDRKSRAADGVRGVPFLGDTSALLTHRIMPYVDRVVITVSSTAQARVQALVEKLGVLPNEITLFVDLGGPGGQDATLSRLADIPLAHLSGRVADARRAFAKRAQDLVLGALALLLAAPLMAVIAIAVKLDSPGPVLFRQRRHGFNNEEIVIWKFRSMRHELRDEAGERQVEWDDARVTRVGRFIRRTSLDELPQILNVLGGEMSLVGPRPHAPRMKTGAVESARLVAEYAHRHRIKPGMTGWAAIKGSRGPLGTAAAVRQRVALDIDYIERQSFWLDLYIMAMTLPCLLGDRQAAR
ncbi:MAG: exopolysaccharide biosynthesis polyprenyl glycosylphosphotransferase [Caulobacteraceae bacterium]|nr:exopolysaccharide biosynthesis polyprenyl glycosylphosphotransferase [Caulobacteraceae bacterium]